jgi:hypothetical protein
MKKGLGPAPAGSVQTQYSDSSQVRRERQQKVTKRVSQGVTLEDLKRTPRRVDWDRGDAFLVEQRDGSMMLVDPRLSQQVR